MKPTSKSALRGLLTTGALAFAVIATSSVAHAAGFAIYETSARGFAMGNANVGRNDDASALYSNPAAITQLEGTQIIAGAAFISPSIDITTNPDTVAAQTTAMNSYTEVVPHLYLTQRFGNNLAAGLAVYVPFGLKSDFPQNWAGRYNNYLTDIKTIDINPNIAYRIVHDLSWAKQISISAGVQFLYLDVDLERYLPPAPQLGPLGNQPWILKGSTWECGWNAAIQWEINDQWAFGVVYKSGFKVNVTGANEQIGNIINNHDAAGQISLPDSWSFGLNYTPIAPLNIGIAATWTGWSDYKQLTIYSPTLGTRVSEKDWSNVWRYSIGAEYRIINPLSLRAGFVIDKDPVNSTYADYMVPSNDRQIYSIGLGWHITKAITVDASYGYVSIKSSHINARPADGVFNTDVHTGNANIWIVSANVRF